MFQLQMLQIKVVSNVEEYCIEPMNLNRFIFLSKKLPVFCSLIAMLGVKLDGLVYGV